MTRPRTNPYLYLTWIPRYLTGEKSCLWAAWFKANFQNYEKMPSDFDSAKWNMEHTDLLTELVDRLEEQGCQVFIESQNSFKVESPRSGFVISGKPDVIAVHPDGRVVVYDVKTGQESASHVAQVQLYMYLLPKAQGARWRGMKFEGAVVYKGGREVPIPADSVNENCSHCRRNTDDNCKAWREARESVAVLTQEARRIAKGLDELRDATGGRTANIYQFVCGSVAYFASDAPDFQEAGELKGDDIDKALGALDASGA